MSCPWYKDGMCTSPKLEHPSSDPVSLVLCLGGHNEYAGCRYFSEKRIPRAGPTMSSVAKFGKSLFMIHALSEIPESNCEFFEVENHESHYLAGCVILGRYLTKFEVMECEKGWSACPYRKIELALAHKRS